MVKFVGITVGPPNNSLEPWKSTRIFDGPGHGGAIIWRSLGRAACLLVLTYFQGTRRVSLLSCRGSPCRTRDLRQLEAVSHPVNMRISS